MSTLPAIAVKPGRHFPFFARHPWVHVSSLVDIDPGLPAGTVVDLTKHDGQWIARGLYNPHSRLRVRLYSWDANDQLNDAFFVHRLQLAWQRRDPLQLNADDAAVRLLFSEADGLSGLIVDRYADTLVLQLTAAVMERFLDPLVEALQQQFQPRAIVLRTDPKLQAAEQFSRPAGVVAGSLPDDQPILFRQNGLQLEVDLLHGQKTGAYLDQRENHAAAAKYLLGRRVLDMCCHTGGFGLLAAQRGAEHVLAIDSSDAVLQAARRNAERNQVTNLEFATGNCFDRLGQLGTEGQQFDAVILDPPRLAGSKQKMAAAMRAYFRLNRSAIDLLPPGGILVTCSCSGRVSRADFLNTLVDVGRHARRDITVMETRGAAPDHPMRVSCPDSDYLKCLICEVQ